MKVNKGPCCPNTTRSQDSFCYQPFGMAESPDLKPVVYVAPIWRRKKRIKSFKQAAAIILELLRLGAYSKQSRLTFEMMTEQLKQLANEDHLREERLRKVQCIARTKKADKVELAEWKQQCLKIYRERFHQFSLLEKMKQYDGNRWMRDKPTNNAASLGSLKYFGTENRKLGSPFLKTNQNITNTLKAMTPSMHRLSENCLMKRSDDICRAVDRNEAKRSLRKGHQVSNATTMDTDSRFHLSFRGDTRVTNVPSPGDTRDPRFQNLLRSLTPNGF